MLDITPLRSPAGDSDAEPSRVSSLETCESDLRFLCSPLRLPRGSPPGRQKVTRLPPSCFISTHHVRTRLPRYMHPHLLYQKWVNYSARSRPPPPFPPSTSSVRGRGGNFWGRRQDSNKKVAPLFTGHFFCRGSERWILRQTTRKRQKDQVGFFCASWIPGATSQFSLKNCTL